MRNVSEAAVTARAPSLMRAGCRPATDAALVPLEVLDRGVGYGLGKHALAGLRPQKGRFVRVRPKAELDEHRRQELRGEAGQRQLGVEPGGRVRITSRRGSIDRSCPDNVRIPSIASTTPSRTK